MPRYMVDEIDKGLKDMRAQVLGQLNHELNSVEITPLKQVRSYNSFGGEVVTHEPAKITLDVVLKALEGEWHTRPTYKITRNVYDDDGNLIKTPCITGMGSMGRIGCAQDH